MELDLCACPVTFTQLGYYFKTTFQWIQLPSRTPIVKNARITMEDINLTFNLVVSSSRSF